MKIVVIGGSGLIGTEVVNILTGQGHEALAASPKTGVEATTGRGLAEALARAEVVVDVSNAPSFEAAAALACFEEAGRHLAHAEREAGVRHHVALSVVGTDRLPDHGYCRAKLAQERLINTAGLPYTIIRATQCFAFLGAIAAAGAGDTRVRLSTASVQPIAADDVAQAVAEAALGSPVNEAMEIAGPARRPLSALVARYLQATHDPREGVSDPEARSFGTRLDEPCLVPVGHAHLGTIRLEEWLRQPRAR